VRLLCDRLGILSCHFVQATVLRGRWQGLEHGWRAKEERVAVKQLGYSNTLEVLEEVEDGDTVLCGGGLCVCGVGGVEDVFRKIALARKYHGTGAGAGAG
jgi:hypothetical protein